MNPSFPSDWLMRAFSTAVHARRLWQWLLFGLTVVVCYLALSPAPPPSIDLGWDKLNHTSAFAALTLAGLLAYPGSRRAVLWVLLSMLALGALIEVLQSFVPGRSSDWIDLLADAVGMAAGAALALVALRLAKPAPGAPA